VTNNVTSSLTGSNTSSVINCDQVRVPFGLAQQGSLTLQFEVGQRWGVIGRNGSGKSQLLACLAGLQQPLAGNLTWQLPNETKVNRISSIQNWSRLVSYQPAVMDETFNETLAERLEILNSHFYDLSVDEQTKEQQVQLLSMFNLQHLVHRPVQSLSSGEQQRTWLVQRLLQPAPIVLLDEPLAHQDLAYQDRFGQWLEKNVRQGNQRLAIICLHQLDWAARFCTHILAIDANGQFIAGKVDQILTPEILESVFELPFKSSSFGVNLPIWTRIT
jgi:ABC-type cobalamin/Fe3+-siderophores transport system ATPase subunit